MPSDMTTILKDRSARLCLLSALTLLGVACDDDVPSVTSGGSSSDGGGTTGNTSTTSTTTPVSTTAGSGTTTSADTTTDASAEGSDSSGDPTKGGSTTMVDPTEGDTTSTTGDESSSSSSSTGELVQECPYGELMAPDLINADTTGQDSEFTNSCGGGGAPDASYTMVAPSDGTYFFTATSPNGVVDPLVAVYDGTCGGPELACNEDIDGGTSAARVSVSLTAGQEVTVVLDGFSLGGGAIDLEVAFFEGMCPDGDVGVIIPVTLSGDTTDGDNTTFSSCGGGTGNDDQWTFTAPTAGIYTADTLGSDFDTVLYALQGCGGSELACNDDAGDATSRINVTLAEGEEVVFVVDGADLESGSYNLNVELDACPDFELVGALPIQVTGNTASEVDSSSPACGFSNAPDVSYTYTAPVAGTYIFDTEGSSFDTVLDVLEGFTCEGTSLGCDDDDPDLIGNASRVAVTLTAGQEVTVLVDGFSANSGDYVLNVSSPECGDSVIQFGEVCDTDNFDGETCGTQGLGAGDLACTASCTIDLAGCDTCGNGTVEGDDDCDGVALGQQTCTDQGFDGGALDCDANCAYDTSQCANGILVYCSAPGADVLDNETTLDTITIPDVGVVADVDVFVDVSHTWASDVDISLSADDLGLGNDIALDPCGTSDNFFATFNDEGSLAVGVDCDEPIAVEGNLTPLQPLSVYDGGASNGDWTLSVTDDAGGIEGVLNEWCIYITLE